MQEKLTKIFQENKYETDQKLAENIWRTIVIHEGRMNKFKLWAFTVMGTISLLGLVPAFNALISDLAKSGFSEYFSLIFSDGGLALSFWKELTFSLAESLPMVSIILTLSLVFVCFLSLRYIMKQINKESLTGSRLLSI